MNYWEKVFQGNNGYYMDLDNPSRLIIKDYIKPDDSVLDLGCGGGALCSLIKNPYYGLDYSETAIELAKKRYPQNLFKAQDTRDLSDFEDNQYDVVVMRHFLENQEDWKKTVEEAFRICSKKVILVMRRPFVDYDSKVIENTDDTWVWDINYEDFNLLARELSVNVSYGKVNDEELVIIGKHLDDAVFDLDDQCPELDAMPKLLELKERFPKLKVSLFCILSKCPDEWIKSLKCDWIQFCLHGDLHDTENGVAQETNHWTAQEMNDYLDKAEAKGLYEKVFRAPGWNYNHECVKVLADRGYVICEHLSRDRWEGYGGKRYTTGHLFEVHGHTWPCNMNGVEELATSKCNFSKDTTFHFITEIPRDVYLPNRYQ